MPLYPPPASGGGAVDSVNTQTGVVVLDADDIDDTSTTHKYVTSTDVTKLSNLSGTNTGDQDLSTYQVKPVEGAFVDGDKTKLDGIEAGADVTDTTNVTAAGALMDSEVTNLAQVKAFSNADYATAAQGALADSAVQDLTDLGLTATATELNYVDGVTSSIQTQLGTKANTSHTHPTTDLTATGGTSTSYLRKDNTWATPTNTTYTEISEAEITSGTASTARTISGRRSEFIVNKARDRANHTGTQTASTISDFDTEVSNNTDVAANTSHRSNTSNPHSVTASQVGLGNVDNTSDATKNSATATLTNKTISGANNTITNIGSSSLTPTKSTDANGWTVYDYGTWKEYHQRQTGDPASINSGSGLTISALSLPVGVSSINDVHVTMTGCTSFAEIAVRWVNNSTIGARLHNHYGSALNATYYRIDWFLKDA